MSGDIARLDLRLRRRSTVGYTVGLAGYAFLIVALYPSFRHDSSLDRLTRGNQTLGALLGATGSLTTPDGWMNANLYANLVPLFALFMTIGYGAAAIAGQDEDGTLGTVAALPLTRGRLIAEKLTALTLLALPVPLVTLLAALGGAGFALRLTTGPLLGVTVAVTLLAVDFGAIALAVGAWTGRRGTALGVAVTLAAAGYVISALAPAVAWVHRFRWTSPFYWSVGTNQLHTGLPAGSLLALVLLGLLASAAACWGLLRLDIH